MLRPGITFTLILLITLAPSLISAEDDLTNMHNMKEFRSSSFSFFSHSEGYFLLNLDIPTGSKAINFVDIGNDKYTDIITYALSKDETKIIFSANYFNQTAGVFNTRAEWFSIDNDGYSVRNLISNVWIPLGSLSFIVTVSKSTDPEYLITYIYAKKDANGDYEKIHTIDNSAVIVADIDGDRRMDIIFYDTDTSRETVNTRQVLHFSDNYMPVIQDFESYLITNSACTNSNNYLNKRISSHFGSAFVDVDADCRTDLLITNPEGILEVYRGMIIPGEKATIKYCLSSNSEFKLNQQYGPFALGDYDGNGFIDLAFPVRNSNTVDIVYNKHTPDTKWTENFCVKNPTPNAPNDIFDFSEKQSVSLRKENENFSFYTNAKLTNTILRVADYENEGCTSFIVIQENQGNRYVRLYRNMCKKEKKIHLTLSQEIQVDNAEYATFFDFDENGLFDIIVVTPTETRGYYHSYYPDTFFIKAETMLRDSTFYSMEPGTGYRYIATNNDGSRRMNYAWQWAQMNDLTLSVPYALVGIGRSNNYIENFQVISNAFDNVNQDTNESYRDHYTFTPIIPNSQLIVSKIINDKEKVEWKIDLIVKPTSTLIKLVIVIAVILLIILIVIIVLHAKEVKEDKMQDDKFKTWF